MGHQLSDPLRVDDVGLVAGQLLQMVGVGQPTLHDIFEDVVDRLPNIGRPIPSNVTCSATSYSAAPAAAR
jgi:hypothetical protein